MKGSFLCNRLLKASYIGILAVASILVIALHPRIASAQQGNSIHGRVITDDGRPLPNAAVTLFKMAGGIRGQKTTNQAGEFDFTNLPDALYTISVASFGHVDSGLDDTSNPRARTFLPGDSVTIRMTKGGVITGRVTNARGEPVVALTLTAARVRDAEGRTVLNGGGNGTTDDRGIYRIFALLPGSYTVTTLRSSNGPNNEVSPYQLYPQTYYPSATRDGAKEVIVTTGSETTGIDISFREQIGHKVTGQFNNQQWGAATTVGVRLASVDNRNSGYTTTVRLNEMDRSFEFVGVEDGEYELTGSFSAAGVGFSSPSPQKVTVKGADVTGLRVSFVKLGTIAGHFSFDDKTATQVFACDNKRKIPLQTVMTRVRSDERSRSSPLGVGIPTYISDSDEKGEFIINNLSPAHYRINAEMPTEDLYISNISKSDGKAASQAKSDSLPSLISLGQSEKVDGIMITVGRGAAGISGVLQTNEPIFENAYQVFLIPVDPQAANATWRYYESHVETNGKYGIKNIMPGKYWIIARSSLRTAKGVIPADESIWDDTNRAKLRQEAEKNGKQIELTSCQRLKDQILSLGGSS